MKSLLNKTLTQFIVCTIIILLLATPLFYLLTKHYYAEKSCLRIPKCGKGKY